MKKYEAINQFVKDKKDEEAIKLLFQTIEKHPYDPIGYVNAAGILTTINKFEEAERFLLRAIELDETVATAFLTLGNLYYKQERFTEVERAFLRAHELGINDSDMYYLLGMTHVKRNQLMFALPYLQLAVETGTGIDETFQYGLTLAKLNYLKEAKEVFFSVLEKDQQHVDTLYNLPVIFMHEGNEEKAKEYLLKTLKVSPNHTFAKNALEASPS